MSIRTRIRVAAGIGVASTLALSGCTEQSPFEGKFVFPIVWSPSNGPEMDSLQSSRLRLNEDGTAVLGHFPFGMWHEESRPSCIDFEGELVSGEGVWEFMNEGKILLTVPEGSISIYSDTGLFGSVDWSSVFVVECDGTKYGFGIDSQIIRPTP
ncbi:hypothetical protein [Microbacterium galbinum]|uniref:hypothetical protein n=1 Tax=Microbacterium galbinum TaxID=2851646 RepID=UPI001FFC3E64|nr:hypothetical protein [Microbacterium galbinum]MCK2030451.1 hypothetical protein [Microbacterium galbinum]